jgi:tetratricopeptide (TPR) repeat protein
MPSSRTLMPARIATSRTVFAVASAAVLALLAAAYWPGLQGGFLFDDYINLDQLGRYGGVRDFTRFLYFLTSGEGDPTGRPVAQLSWLLDARNWPADPWPFKRTNLVIHLLNGALLLALLRRLQRWLHDDADDGTARTWTPLLAATLWTAHPLWVSTTLYVVQRQAMLATTFVLLGLLAWDIAYDRLREGAIARGWGWLAFGTGGATLLAGLSKANGFLLPLLALVTWWTLQSRGEQALPATRRSSLHRSVAGGIGLPALAIFLYVLAQIPSAMRRAVAVRGWTLGERLLSEPRALVDYLGLLLAPREGSSGIFTDSFATSHGLLDPWTTLPALLCVIALIGLGIAVRRTYPRLSVALLFFFAAHCMESGPVPLELYFEHRNYLPALLLAWPLAHALLSAGRAQRLRLMLAIALPLMALALTWQRAIVWGDPPLQAALWAQRNPDSARAQAYAAEVLMDNGHDAEARAVLARAETRTPGQTEIALNQVAQACASGQLDPTALTAAEHALGTAHRWNQGLLDWLDQTSAAVLRGRCDVLGDSGLQRLLAASAGNPAFIRSPARRQALLRLQGRNALARGDAEAALRAFDQGLEIDPKPQVALVQAAELGSAGVPALGLRHLDRYAALAATQAPVRVRDMPTLHAWVLLRTGYYRGELHYLRRQLQVDAAPTTHPRPAGTQ